jgi:hypothetical protein
MGKGSQRQPGVGGQCLNPNFLRVLRGSSFANFAVKSFYSGRKSKDFNRKAREENSN